MRERPIPFTAPMVRAILDGRKTQTRRVVKWPAWTGFEPPDPEKFVVRSTGSGLSVCWPTPPHNIIGETACPYGAPGDRLWVRETWQLFDDSPLGFDAAVPPERLGPAAPWKGCQDDRSITWRTAYRADGDLEHPTHGPANWKPSIHMPRWASRITLEVTGVRVERLQTISTLDAMAEGVEPVATAAGAPSYTTGFHRLWDQINGKRAPWSSNPFVWVIQFARVFQFARVS